MAWWKWIVSDDDAPAATALRNSIIHELPDEGHTKDLGGVVTAINKILDSELCIFVITKTASEPKPS